MTIVAAAASLLAALPLSALFQQRTWYLYAAALVVAGSVVAFVLRGLRVPVWAPSLAMMGVYGLALTWLFPSGGEIGGLLPSVATLRHFNDLLVDSARDLPRFGVPVPDRPGFLLLSTLGVAGMAVLVDAYAVELRCPALAGLPMLALYLIPVAAYQTSVNPVPFGLGAAAFVWLLRTEQVDRVRTFGPRCTADGRRIERWERSPLVSAGRRLSVVGILLAALVPLAVPALGGGLLGKLGRVGAFDGLGGRSRSGAGVSVDLFANLAGELNRTRPIDMLTVSTSDRQPQYLRFAVADRLTTGGFASVLPTTGRPVRDGLPGPAAPGGTPGAAHRARVEVLSLDLPYLPVYPEPTRVNGLDGSWRHDPATSVLYSTSQSTRRLAGYEFEYVRTTHPSEVLRGAAPLPAADPVQQQFASVPSRHDEVDATVARLTNGRRGSYEKVLAIFGHFDTSNGFSYSLSTRPGTSGADIVNFLRNKRGFCVQYAAAMAWLVRAAGIPARVAFGFTRGAGPAGGATTLTSANLHAWTEVYLGGSGWVRFDPTPADAIAGPAPGEEGGDPGARAGPPNEPAPDPSAGSPLGPSPSSSAPPGAAPSAPGGRRWPYRTVLGALAVLAVLATIGAPAVGRRYTRHRRLRLRGPGNTPGVARRRAHAVWAELVDTMTDYRMPVAAAATPRGVSEFLIAGASLGGSASAHVRQIARAEERARYAREPLHAGPPVVALREVRSAVAAQAALRTRIGAVLLPLSTLRRWRSRAAGRLRADRGC